MLGRLYNPKPTVMTKRIKSIDSNGIISILLFLLFFLSSTLIIAATQSQQLTQADFSNQLRQAYNKGDDQLVVSLIKDHRLFVKQFVNDLITESISNELKGKDTESGQSRLIAEKTAATFESIFGEKSLTTGVNYLKSWSREQKGKKLVADSLYVLGTSLRGKSQDREKAIEVHQQVLDLYKEIGDERGESEVLGGLGLIYSNKKDYNAALPYYQEALKVREKVDDKFLMGNSLNSIGAICNNLHDYPQAVLYYDKAEKLRTEIGDLQGLTRTQSLKANTYLASGELMNNRGKYPEALENIEKAIQLYKKLNDKSGTGNALSQMGFVYTTFGEYNTALEKLKEAETILKEENNIVGLAGVYNHFGIVLQKSGRLERALEYFNNSLKIYEENKDQENVVGLLSNIGTLLFDSRDYIKAEEYLNKALQISREIKDKELEANCLLNLANDQTLLGKYDEAMSYYNSGLTIALSLNSPDLIWKLVGGEGEYFEKREEYDKAVQLNDSALKILEGIRSTLQNEDQKASFMARERFAYEDVIDMLCSFYEKDKTKGYDILAFQYAEHSKSRVLLELLTESVANLSNGNGRKSEAIKNPQPVSLKEAQALCPDKNTVILEYSVGDSSSCLWVITQSAHQLFRLPARKLLQEQIESFRFALLNPDQTNNEFFTKGGYSLYQKLLQPSEPYLTKKSKLVIIPDGVLNYLPFEVLLTDNKSIGSSPSFSELPYLMKKYPVSYAQSASVLKSLLAEKSGVSQTDPGNRKLVAFGDPVYETVNDSSHSSSKNFQRLEYSGKEIENIASLFKKGNTDLYLRGDATEENVKREGELKKFNYVHFATHGFIDESKPDLSSLVLTQDKNSEEDGFLQATEIFNLNLNADLVVLSACQTGLGKLIRGEGMVGLTRAFMYAGTPSVLVSLWSVKDASTATLMTDFYKNLIKEKLSKTDALRKAQLSMLGNEKFAHPFYWAPFVLVGDWR